VIPRRLSEIAAAVAGRVSGGDAEISRVVTDSRLAKPGALFVALRGDHMDGHAFVSDAFANGASAAVVDATHEVGADRSLVTVADTGRALLELAADERRRRPDARVVAITGANGKTSTKDLAAAVLARDLGWDRGFGPRRRP
jgi:UDP-N-acetylmuramoyl-tripeptide--D-alanyl-D-alanine ligase